MAHVTGPVLRSAGFAAAIVLAAAIATVPAPAAAFLGGGTSASGKTTTKQDLARAEKLIGRKKYRGAAAVLEKTVRKDKGNADAFNLLGYAHRKLRNFDRSLRFYQKALALDPKHQGANEYLGELYLQTGELAKAETRLAALREICGEGCEAYRELAEAIAAYKQKASN